MKPAHSGFTILELLVAIGIISLLMAILLPAAERVRHQAYIDKCAANLQQIGLSLQTYADENHGNFPRTVYSAYPAGITPPLVTGTGSSATDSFLPVGPGTVQPNDLTAAIFLLMRAEHLPPALFICPYNDDTSYAADSPHLTGRSNFTDEKKNLGYSFANPYPNSTAATAGYRLTNHLRPDFAIAADRNPGIDTIKDNIYVPTAHSPASVIAQSNSNNHEKDGQNVLFADGHVAFSPTPFVGIAQDNIYTARNMPAAIEASPVDNADSVLLPTEDD